MTRRRFVVGAVGGLLVLGLVGGLLVGLTGGWASLAYEARLFYFAHLAPLTWPRDPFSADAWARTPPTNRYRLARSLLGGDRLKGLTASELEGLLGEKMAPGARRCVYPLQKTGFQNLWWTLVVDLEDGRVTAARRDLAWLDP